MSEHPIMDGTVAHARSIIESQFPELSPASVSYLGEGCDSRAFDVNGEWVFRFPKRADVEQRFAVEAQMLPVLAERSPLPIPVFTFHGRPSTSYPFHFAGYRKLPGEPAIRFDERTLRPTDGARALAPFLSWLHRFPVRDAEAHGVAPRDAGDLIDEVRTDALDDFERLHEVFETAPFDQWRAFLAAGCPPPPANSPSVLVLVHGDLASEHVLYDSARQDVTGIIDWSAMALSDAAIDFMGFWHWGGRPCFEVALSLYDMPIDNGVAVRARYLAACRGVADVAFGLQMRRREYVEAGSRALVMCLGGDVLG